MRKLRQWTIVGMLVLALTGCGAGKEEEVFEQGNIMTVYGPIMETENAYYYTTNGFRYELHYYDKATGKSIFLCNKPECSHDGNEFCAASAGDRFVMYTALYKDGIYMAALEPEENRVDKKLFKVSLDGTKMETIATFGYEPTDGGFGHFYDTEKYMVIYQGKAFIPYASSREDGFNNYGTAIVDIKSGKVEYMEECDGLKLYGQERYIPYGEYLYYYETGPYRSPILYRYHISKETVEEIPITDGFVDYCIVDGRVVYSQLDEDGYVHFYSMNPEDPDNPDTKDLTGPLTAEDGTPLLSEWEGVLRYDGDYLVTFSYPKKSQGGFQYYIFSKDGTFLTEFTPPENFNKDMTPDFAIMNGYVYFAEYASTVRCDLQDLLDGNPTWTTLFYTGVEEE